MNHSCISEPVSYLRLERYLIDEITPTERADVQAHLSQCEACRVSFETLRADSTALAPLPEAQRPARSARILRLPLMAAGSVLAAAAAVLLFLRQPDSNASPKEHVATGAVTKGGELVISLVREHQGSIAVDPSVFVAGDRFEVQVTCPPRSPLHWDVVVQQGGETFFPFRPDAPLHCGNHVTLPGAFKLTGQQIARVCVVVQAAGAVDRQRLPEASACADLTPAP